MSIGIAKTLFCVATFFKVSYGVKHPRLSPFQVHLQTFLEVLATVQSSYSVQNLLAPASEERKSTVDVILGVLKTHKLDGSSLQVCKFLIRKTIRDHFLEVFCKFQNTSKKFEKEFVFSSVQTLYCKPATLVKRRLLKICRAATFRNIPCTYWIFGQSCKTLEFLLL